MLAVDPHNVNRNSAITPHNVLDEFRNNTGFESASLVSSLKSASGSAPHPVQVCAQTVSSQGDVAPRIGIAEIGKSTRVEVLRRNPPESDMAELRPVGINEARQ
jgi:hypothetical protein